MYIKIKERTKTSTKRLREKKIHTHTKKRIERSIIKPMQSTYIGVRSHSHTRKSCTVAFKNRASMPLQMPFESSTFYFYDLVNNAGNGENKTQKFVKYDEKKRMYTHLYKCKKGEGILFMY